MKLESLKGGKFEVIEKNQMAAVTGGKVVESTQYSDGDVAGAPKGGHSDKLYYNDLNQIECIEVLDKAGTVIWYKKYIN